MSLRRLLTPLVGVLASLVVVVVSAIPALAASSSVTGGTGDGFKVSPVTTNLVINKGETHVVTVYVQNVTTATVTLQAFVNDFIASSDESGQPALLLDPNQYAPSHSLKRYVAPIDNFT